MFQGLKAFSRDKGQGVEAISRKIKGRFGIEAIS
jgi:hypothetical protein